MCAYCVCVCACDQEYATLYLSDFIILMITEVGEQHYQSTTNVEFLKSDSMASLSMLLAYSIFIIIESPMLGEYEFGGLEWWNGTVEWSTGLDYWSATPTNAQFGPTSMATNLI